MKGIPNEKDLKFSGVKFFVKENIITASYDKSKCNFDDLFQYLKQNSLEILDIVTEDADLEDVFIQLTKS